ncbi:right-handed parallel beta-helix repeat-containing protein, partial [bacterium]|nr:right-handed parallel beta-helix repeat-containing protein [candidate division CSSED10-310 bacterium]
MVWLRYYVVVCFMAGVAYSVSADTTGPEMPVERWYEGELYSFGAIRPDPDEVAAKMRHFPKSDSGRSHFDWRDLGGVTPAKNQVACGACWAFAVIGTLESHFLIEYGIELDLSEQILLSCDTRFRGCCGGNSSAFSFFYSTDPVLESCYPFGDGGTSCSSLTCPPDCSSVACDTSCPGIGSRVEEGSHYYVDIDDPDAVIAALEVSGPAFISYSVHTDFLNYWRSAQGTAPWTDGVYINYEDSFEGGHGVLIIGYDTENQYWICKNSWGRTGGPFGDGTFRIKWSGHLDDILWGVANCEVTGPPFTPVPPTATGTPTITPTPTDTPIPPDNDTCTEPENYLVGQCICDTIYGATDYHDCGDGHDGGDRVYAFHDFNPGSVYEFRGEGDFNADWTISTICSPSSATVACADRSMDAMEPSCGYLVTPHPYGRFSMQWTATTTRYYIWVDARTESIISGDYCLEVVLVATPTPTPLPQDIHVPDDYATIQAAIDAALPGDRVIIANGTYRGPGNTNLTYGGKPITVQSQDGPYFCIIDCEGVSSGVRFGSGEDDESILRGLTIRNGGYPGDGGGVYCFQSSPMITDCRFERNVATQHGGGIYCEESTAVISHCVFEHNEAGQRGGAICCVDASPVVTNCALIRNFATDLGGGIYCDDYAAPSFRNITSYANGTDNEGGGIAVGVNASPSVINSILFYNDPGEIYLAGGTISVTYSDVAEGWTGQGNTDDYPQFVTGPLGDLYLNIANSPCIDSGSTAAANVWFYLAPGELVGMDDLTTRIDTITDSGIVDMGYHYPTHLPATSTPTPTPYITPTSTPIPMVIRVPQDYATIQAAINAASNGQTVLIDDGIYTGPGNREISTLGKQIIVRSVSGPESCIIDCEYQSYGFKIYMSEGRDTVIRGLTIRHGDDPTAVNYGGGMILFDVGCHVTDCIFEDCISEEGGGLYVTGSDSDVLITNCIFRGNVSTNDYGFGGGMYVSSGLISLINCLFEDNTADSGGGIGVSGVDTVLTMSGCTITGNHTVNANRTGGFYNAAGTLICENSIIYFNDFTDYRNYETAMVTTSNVELTSGVVTGTGNINADPMFEIGPFGAFYLNQLPVSGSPCVDTGGSPAANACFSGADGIVCMNQLTTDPAGPGDSGTVDMGYHYPLNIPTYRLVPENYATIQAAIDAAGAHDIVLVAPGNYTGTGNWDLDFQGKNIIVRAADGPVTTRLLLGNAHRGFHFHSGESRTAFVDGFSMISGYSSANGGAILCSGSSPSIVNCVFESCAANTGGALYVTGGTPYLANCRFNANYATEGGAMLLFDTEMDIINCAFWENNASNYGGAVELDRCSGPIDFQNCTMYMNVAGSTSGGGGVLAYASELIMLNCIAWQNEPNQITSQDPAVAPDIDYCDIEGGWTPGTNMNLLPFFFDGPDGGVLYL